jgi:hypothetical protein
MHDDAIRQREALWCPARADVRLAGLDNAASAAGVWREAVPLPGVLPVYTARGLSPARQ